MVLAVRMIGLARRGPTGTPLGKATGQRRRAYLRDIGVGLGFLAVAAWIGHGLWPDPATRVLALNPADQTLIEWFLAVDTRVLLGEHGLVTDRLNAPDGVNLLVNASALTLGVLLAPITLTLGAPVSFAVLTVGNLAATALAWYLLFSRTLGADRVAAAVGGGFCGFAPAMISQSNSHWHMTAQWLVPAIVWCVVRLARHHDEPGRVLASGLALGGLVVVQLFLGEEVLYLTALSLALFTAAYAALRPTWARRVLPGFAAGMAVAGGSALLVLVYPLWMQFAGPLAISDGLFDPYYFSADLASWPAFSPLSLAGSPAAAELATGPAEYNTFLGWPLLLVGIGCVVWRRHDRLVVSAAIVAGVMAVLSLGPRLVVAGEPTSLPLPFALLTGVPVIDGALPQRYAMAVVPLLAIILVRSLTAARGLRDRRARVAVPLAIGLALLPLVPTPLPTTDRAPVPEFITAGHWRGYVEPGGVLVPVPPPTPRDPEPMRWAAAAHAEFSLPEGFFIGPYGPNRAGAMGTAPLPTSRLLAQIATDGSVPALGPTQQAQARHDLARWGAQAVVLGPGQPHETALRTALEQLLGPPERVADAWVWRC